MNKGKAIGIMALVAIVGILAGITMGAFVSRPTTGTIIGNAFVDVNGNLALDYPDFAAEGLRVAIYEVNQTNRVLVEEVIVDGNGEYQFTVPAGKYEIQVVHAISGIYPLRYNSYYFRKGNILEIQNGQTILGPTILLYQYALG